MLLIALGESVLAIGVGLGTGVEAIGLEQIAFAAISLLLATTLYWAYFGVGEDTRAEAALDALPADRAQAAGLASYGYAFWVILFGIVLSAAGLHHALVHPTDRLGWEYAGQLCLGRWPVLGRTRPVPAHPGSSRCAAAPGGGVVLGAVIVVGATVSGLVALLCLLLGSAALRAVRAARGSTRSTSRLSSPHTAEASCPRHVTRGPRRLLVAKVHPVGGADPDRQAVGSAGMLYGVTMWIGDRTDSMGPSMAPWACMMM